MRNAFMTWDYLRTVFQARRCQENYKKIEVQILSFQPTKECCLISNDGWHVVSGFTTILEPFWDDKESYANQNELLLLPPFSLFEYLLRQ